MPDAPQSEILPGLVFDKTTPWVRGRVPKDSPLRNRRGNRTARTPKACWDRVKQSSSPHQERVTRREFREAVRYLVPAICPLKRRNLLDQDVTSRIAAYAQESSLQRAEFRRKNAKLIRAILVSAKAARAGGLSRVHLP